MKIKEQTRKLAVGCLKQCFEVVDRTDEVSSKYCFEVADGELTWFEDIFEEYKIKTIPTLTYSCKGILWKFIFQEPLNGLFLKIPAIFIASSS
ncbi:hypothetical protein [Streptococcus pneumoniae]|uniref:hypothetical protein n=1 Tax=Streptococcus pneumoniae TaxID=1313 RepID=UPI001D00AD83|nr:hypothetical protein [Streptococcus pneumoniae]